MRKSTDALDCKRICKRTTQHGMARVITNRNNGTRNAEPAHTLSHETAQANPARTWRWWAPAASFCCTAQDFWH